MRLEKLCVCGFKSFADRTEFVFQAGLTAFVGPNGCGKSNVVDAVKWVLGEQSVKALRGNEMQDVIFNGAPTRRSTGYAEATLTLSNTKGLLPTDYETIGVTRRLYRSGESEYYINKQRCRLRDIRDLFMDTGIGMDAYSIIEQGKVDVLLTSNKQGRRAIFEEAAGISKYKAQKRICQSKLERVGSNLLRLGDIIDEVEKRMRSVKYQAAKARRWKRLDDQRRELSVALALHQYDLLVKDRDATAQELTALRSEAGGLHAGIERMEAELSELETAVIEADQRIATLESEDVLISSRLGAAEDAIRLNEQRIAELNDLEEATKADIARSEAALELMGAELDKDTTEIADLDKAISTGKAELAERSEAITEIENTLRGLQDEIEEKRVRAVDLASERAKHNNELSAIAAQREQLERQDRRLVERAQERRDSLTACGERRQGLRDRSDAVAERIGGLEQERAAVERERERIVRQVSEFTERMNSKRSETAAVNSRRELLHDLEQKLEGVSAGVKHLLEASRGESPAVSGICGVIADCIEVDVQHAAAVEAALGPHEQLVVTESFSAMTDAIDFLAQGEKGKVSFLPVDVISGQVKELGDYPHLPEVVGRAVDLIRRPAELDRPLRYLLGDVLVVRDIHAAKQLAATNGHGVRYATLDGQLLNPRGVSLGGAARGASGVISRRSELRALEVQQAQLEADVAVLEKQREDGAQKAAQSQRRIGELMAQVADARSEAAGVQAEFATLEASVKRLESELAANESERAEIADNIQALGGREAEVREESGRIEQSEAELKAALAEQARLVGESEAARERARSDAAGLEVAQAQRVEKAGSLRRRLDELDRLIAERQKSLETSRAQVANCTRRRSESTQTIFAKKAEIAGLLQRRGSLGAEKAEAANRREVVRVQFDSRREERNAASRQAKEADAKLNKLNVHATEIAMRIENLEHRAQSEYDASLAEQYQGAEGEERNWDEVAQEIESVNQKMKSMGVVNTYAIEELEQLQTRAAELTRQREDLQKAEHTLKEIIRKINRRSREMFRKTFDDVRENFQGLFRKLFGGGRADIVLDEDVDILDAGIDIIACPPGKEPASITLLSGGEKAMTAVALLFAIFQSKPSPFCILDEVDAALDESNIDRFCMLVREFLQNSQFLVVTHSRRTMAMADAMYGITMQEPGISTKVSVKFDGESEMEAAG